MKESRDVNQRIASRVRDLRAAHRLSLDALASKSGVSRSMISLIERGKCSPTAVVLEKLAAALSETLASLFDAPPETAAPSPVARRDEQPVWKDPASGYIRRNVSPPGVPQPLHLVEVLFPAGRRVAFESNVREKHLHQQVWILEGTMEITVGGERHRLREGDCIAMQHDLPKMFHNPARKRARYLVAIASEISTRR